MLGDFPGVPRRSRGAGLTRCIGRLSCLPQATVSHNRMDLRRPRLRVTQDLGAKHASDDVVESVKRRGSADMARP